jgi:hypothetical protein
VTQRHELVRLGDILRARRVEQENLPVAGHLQIAVGFHLDLAEVPQQGMHLAPAEIV